MTHGMTTTANTPTIVGLNYKGEQDVVCRGCDSLVDNLYSGNLCFDCFAQYCETMEQEEMEMASYHSHEQTECECEDCDALRVENAQFAQDMREAQQDYEDSMEFGDWVENYHDPNICQDCESILTKDGRCLYCEK